MSTKFYFDININMNYILYQKSISKDELLSQHIVIDESCDVAEGVKIGVGVCILGNTVILEGTEVYGNSIIENSKIGMNVIIRSSEINSSIVLDNTTIGPFAHIRNESEIGESCRIGNFVEIKKSIVGRHTKIAHLTYVGDAEIGTNCNLGCGVVFCNYNGSIKQKSYIGDNVFIGSNVNIIAPVTIEDGAYIAAGSTINKDVGLDEFAIARSRQEIKKNFNNPYKNNKKQ